MHETDLERNELIFVGGGHSNSLVLRQIGMNPLSSTRMTLITDTTYAPYSGMLPGYLAGTYDFEQTHINLRRLCEFSKVRFIHGKVIGLQLEERLIELENRPAIHFDLLSINTGSIPDVESVPGASLYAIPVKPIPEFLASLQSIESKLLEKQEPILIIVGGGAGGVEIALAIQKRWGKNIEIHLVHQQQQLLDTHADAVGLQLAKICRQRGINLHLAEEVTRVDQTAVVCRSGLNISADHIFWSTGASAPAWIKESGLAVDEQGFALVNSALQSQSHSDVFAAGDIATIASEQRPKAGVFAVRAAKPLAENLRRRIQGRPLVKYYPQKRYLSLINTFDGAAIASRGTMMYGSRSMWKWKDRIDRKFMRQFSSLNSMPSASRFNSLGKSTSRLEQEGEMRCKGCAGKVGKSTLHRVLNRLRQEYSHVLHGDDTQIGVGTPDDAAVISCPPNHDLVQSLDYLSSLVSDPYLLGRILALHGFNDIFAMGATAQSANALILTPHAEESMMEQDIFQSLAGICCELSTMKSTLLGGHTAESDQFGLGLQCNGLATGNQLLRKQGIQPGDLLLLTKPLGIGTLFAAQMKLVAEGRWIDNAIDSMLLSNQKAGELFRLEGATACTDVSGFGLSGHLLEMLEGSANTVELFEEQIPVLEGALDTLQAGVRSTLDPQNRHDYLTSTSCQDRFDTPRFDLLFDPQTSGGLLASVPEQRAATCLAKLQSAGYKNCSIVGVARRRSDGQPPIVLKPGKLQ